MALDAVDTQTRAPKLPLWRAIRFSYAAYVQNFADVLRLSWVWLIVAGLCGGIANWLQWSTFARMIAMIRQAAPSADTIAEQQRLAAFAVASHLVHVVLLVAGISVAVGWHRYMILGEQPGVSGSNLVSRHLWRYVGVGLAIALMIFVPMVLVIILIVWTGSAKAAGASVSSIAPFVAAVPAVCGMAAVAVFLRFILLLPARAIGNVDLTFAQVWRRSSGSIWRLFWGILACFLPFSLALQILFFAFVGRPDVAIVNASALVAGMTVFGTLSLIGYVLVTPIWIGFLSIAYQHFFEQSWSDAAPDDDRPIPA